jgi:SAM-dependent methyltransferase
LKHLPERLSETLDVGCGTGTSARMLAERSEHVIAVDLSPRMVEVARMRSKDAGARRLTLVLVDVALQVLAHGVLYPLSAHQEDGAFTDIHAMVSDTLQVVDY